MDPRLPVPPESLKRPRLLSVLCVLTFLGSGLNVLSSLSIIVLHETFQTILQQLIEQFDLPGMDILIQAPKEFFLVSAVLYAGSFSGAVLMWQLRKIGFHVYTISQILLLIAPLYFLKLPGPSVVDLFLTGFFVILYSTQLRSMRSDER